MRQLLGEVTISGRGVVNLPARALRTTGWKAGDRLFVELIGDGVLVLVKRPENIADAFAGRMTHLYPDSDDTRRFLAEERASWGSDGAEGA
jgi:bifunctional DNA-binding transcriptional regulator/antitoxin component of YhaV-PrlF toxin-antitoxin module